MITVKVVTEIAFKDQVSLDRFLNNDDAAKITGFADEIRIAQKTKRPYTFSTPRLDYAMVAKSFIAVEETAE